MARKKKELTPEEEQAEQAKRGREGVASLFRTVAFETLPWMTRAIIENDLKETTWPQLQDVIEEFFVKVFGSLLIEYKPYIVELEQLLGKKLIILFEGKECLDHEQLTGFTEATEYHFYEHATDEEDQERRVTFLALLHGAKSLRLLDAHITAAHFDRVAIETMFFLLSVFQATQGKIIAKALSDHASRKIKPEHFSPRITMARIIASLIEKRGEFLSKKVGGIFREEYPDGTTADGIKFSYIDESEEIYHIKPNSANELKEIRYKKPDGSTGEWSERDLRDIMTNAKKIPKN